jgi:membrane protease YdiL (CAAX protease family)
LWAGFSEELVFRGFLERPFHPTTGSVRAAIVLEGWVFGLGHTDRGWDQPIVISALGMLCHVFAVSSGDLRASMTLTPGTTLLRAIGSFPSRGILWLLLHPTHRIE